MIQHPIQRYRYKGDASVIKTDALLLRDLPFVVNLSKHFDMSMLDPDGTGLKKIGQTHSTAFPNNQSDFHTHIEKAVLNNDNSNLVSTLLDKIKKERKN